MSDVCNASTSDIINDSVNEKPDLSSNTIKIERNDDHYHPTVRLVHVQKLENGACGFNLSRSKWDPYPWVSQVDNGSPAESHGVKTGDCVLEVNGEDIIGMRISDVANQVRSKTEHVSLLLWTTGLDPTCNPESLCCGPMPQNLERLSASVSTILAALECPVCMDTIPPPCVQCLNGHLVCAQCSSRSERCPVCREKFSPGRSLIAEQIFTSITQAFKLCDNESKLREKLFGPKCKRAKKIDGNYERKPSKSHTHTFLAKIMGKSSSVDNLSSKHSRNDEGMLKIKSLSLSSSEIFQSDKTSNCQSTGSNNELTSPQPITYQKRPRSCNVSSEHLHHYNDDIFQIVVPARTESITYQCPYGENCAEKLKATTIHQHVTRYHKVPIITFGTSTAEITLPPKLPVEYASLLLHKGQHSFWLRLICNPNGDLFTSALVQGSKLEAEQYVLEISITNVNESKIHRKELIARNEIFDLEKHSWMTTQEAKRGIFYARESLNATFNSDSEMVLRAAIKKMSDI